MDNQLLSYAPAILIAVMVVLVSLVSGHLVSQRAKTRKQDRIKEVRGMVQAARQASLAKTVEERRATFAHTALIRDLVLSEHFDLSLAGTSRRELEKLDERARHGPTPVEISWRNKIKNFATPLVTPADGIVLSAQDLMSMKMDIRGVADDDAIEMGFLAARAEEALFTNVISDPEPPPGSSSEFRRSIPTQEELERAVNDMMAKDGDLPPPANWREYDVAAAALPDEAGPTADAEVPVIIATDDPETLN